MRAQSLSARRRRLPVAVLAVLCLLAALLVGAARPAEAASDPSSFRVTAGADTEAGSVALNHICDPVDQTACLLPFPNDWFTVADSSTATGRRVNMSILATPRSIGLIPINPAEWNRNDGFSPGSMLLTHVPGVDLARSGAAPITDMGSSLRPDAPIVIVDVLTGERWPYWAELDANATDPARRALIVRPARNFREGHRYDVLLRNLRDAAGNVIPPSAKVADLLDGEPFFSPDRERSDSLRRTVAELQRLGVATGGINLAWTFTVASRRSLTERALHMRDEAFARLGGAAPAVTVSSVANFTPEQDARIARKVRGTIDVPSYLNQPGGPPGSALNYGADGLPEPQPGNVQKARFACNIPRTASAASPARPSLFGHGLLGTLDQIDVGDLKQAAVESNTMFCATDWIGMATEDIPNVISVFGDFSRFKTIPDRLQQSYLDFLFLGRSIGHPAGLTALAAFRDAAGNPLATRTGLVYAGASQGGIQGGALMALAQDFTHGLLAVPGMNYSTLLNRSTQFDQFQPLLDLTYPDKLDQQLGFALLQMLWDRGEANGYAQHIVGDPLPGTPAHRVLLHEAFGDHQVANVATETMARTMGLHVHRPALAPGRSPDVIPVWDVPAIPSYPFPGSALVVWDSGTPAPPPGNVPNRAGHDPHGDTGHTPAARQQAAHFLTTGEVIDTCGGGPCIAIH